MANILLTNSCNLKCEYCFANNEMQNECHEHVGYMTLGNYDKILQWLLMGGEMKIGLMGGEPTIHPQFKEILQMTQSFCRQYGRMSSIFTNGTNLMQFLPLIDRDVTSILLHITEPDVIGDNNWTKVQELCEELYQRGFLNVDYDSTQYGCVLGVNIYSGRDDYTHIYELIRKYNLKRLRVSVTAPTQKKDMNRDVYFKKMAPIFFNFVKNCAEAGIHEFTFDCNNIPQCYFTEEQQAFINRFVFRKPNCIESTIDITPDLKAIPCFKCGIDEKVSIFDFPGTLEIRKYYQGKYIFKMIDKNLPDRCRKCPLGEKYLCHGGCLNFLKEDEINGSRS